MEVNYLLSIALDWKVQMVTSHLNPVDATFSLKNVILWKPFYPLVRTTFSKQQCYQIMAPILQQGLPKAGVVHTFPCALAHGTLDYGGLAIPQLFMEQLIAPHVKTILQYGPDKLAYSYMLLVKQCDWK